MAKKNHGALIMRVLQVLTQVPASRGWADARQKIIAEIGAEEFATFESLTPLELLGSVTLADLFQLVDFIAKD